MNISGNAVVLSQECEETVRAQQIRKIYPRPKAELRYI